MVPVGNGACAADNKGMDGDCAPAGREKVLTEGGVLGESLRQDAVDLKVEGIFDLNEMDGV